jgi:hypothetical protein
MNARELIKSLGGTTKVARKLGEKVQTVHMWGKRQCIPRRVWPEMLDAYPQVTMDTLRLTEWPAPQEAA